MDARTNDLIPPIREIAAEATAALAAVDRAEFAALRALFESGFAVGGPSAARRWFFSGQGRSGLVAQMAAMRFMHLGFETHVVGESTAPSVRAGDGLVLISGSGRTPVSLSFARIAHREGSAVAAVTASPDSPITEIADVALCVAAAAETKQFGGSLFEQCVLLVLDALVLDLAAGSQATRALMARRHTNMQ